MHGCLKMAMVTSKIDASKLSKIIYRTDLKKTDLTFRHYI